MILSMTVLSFLILAANLGVQASNVLESEKKRSIQTTSLQSGNSCCFTYTPRIIQCANMIDYFETSSQCSLAAVIFRTKDGQVVCTNPALSVVQECMKELKSQNNNVFYLDKLPSSGLAFRGEMLPDPPDKVPGKAAEDIPSPWASKSQRQIQKNPLVSGFRLVQPQRLQPLGE